VKCIYLANSPLVQEVNYAKTSNPNRILMSRRNSYDALNRLSVTYSQAGEQYVIEYVPALPATGNGLFQSSFLLTNSPQTLIDPTFTGESKRFYRVRANP